MSPETPDETALRARLEARRETLLAEDNSEARRTVELDQTRMGRLSRIDAMQNQAMAQERDRRRQVEIQRIEAALARMDEGDYGHCVNCDEPIGPRRLESDPAVPTCIRCAAGSG